MKFQTEQGSINISQHVIAGIVSECANNCFGVRGMAYTSKTDGLCHLVQRDTFKKGVKITQTENGVDVELHIVVRYGINIAATGESIANEIRYNVDKLTGINVGNLAICIDGIMTD